MHAQTAHMINIYELGADGAAPQNNNTIGHNNNMKSNGKELSIINGMGNDDGGELSNDLTMLSPRSSTSKEVSDLIALDV